MINYYGNLAEDKTVSSTGSYNVSAPAETLHHLDNADGRSQRTKQLRLFKFVRLRASTIALTRFFRDGRSGNKSPFNMSSQGGVS